MSSSVTLSAAVRANLLALQTTTSLQAQTQQRLATGRKVSSALDNPTNYFTAASLSARAGELTNLLDSMTNGINTLKAADNGLTAITTTLQSMEATVTQARQDASWQSTSYTLDTTAIGTTTAKSIAFSGGSVGTTPVTIALNSQGAATPTSSSAGAQFSSVTGINPAISGSETAVQKYVDATPFKVDNNIDFDGVDIIFDGTTDGSTPIAAGTGSQSPYTEAEAISFINYKLAASGSTVRASDNGSGYMVLANTATGAGSNFTVIGLYGSGPYSGGFQSNFFTTTNGADGGAGVGFTIAVNGGGAQAISVSPTDVTGAGIDNSNGGTNSVNLTAAINTKLAAAGINNVQAVKSGTVGVSASTDTISLQATTTGPGTTFTLSNITGNVVGGTVTIGANAGSGTVYTVDQLVSSINGNTGLTGKVRASNNAGQLQITDLSTSALTVTGVTASGTIDGGTGTATVAANTTRSNLVVQFNQLKDQLDKTAQDASFNGINLLAGDQLKLYFNENSTSYITIQSTNTAGVNSSTLGAGAATNAEFQSNTLLDSRLQSLQGAVTTVASQASAFGNNLAIVQNRQTFTNAMINTLQTGADGLTLADTNLEGANMLSLQTSQQLSIQALSLASQANSAVMRLFG